MASYYLRDNLPSTLPPSRTPAFRFEGWSLGMAPKASAEQAIAALLKLGAVVVARQPHGTLVATGGRLIFVRSTQSLTAKELEDMVRLSGVSAQEFERLLWPSA